MEDQVHITTEDTKASVLSVISDLPTNGSYEVIIKKTAKTRSPLQNKSLHLYLKIMKVKFNEAGIDQAMTFEKFKAGFQLPVTEFFLKEVFQTIAFDMVGKRNTSKLTTVEMQDVYEAFNMGMGQKFGISYPWPDKDSKEDK